MHDGALAMSEAQTLTGGKQIPVRCSSAKIGPSDAAMSDRPNLVQFSITLTSRSPSLARFSTSPTHLGPCCADETPSDVRQFERRPRFQRPHSLPSVQRISNDSGYYY
nr:hypothetical protein CFP56_32419 [Quercus suber]